MAAASLMAENLQIPKLIGDFFVEIMEKNVKVIMDKAPDIIKDASKKFYKNPVKTITVYGPAWLAVKDIGGDIKHLAAAFTEGFSSLKEDFLVPSGAIAKILKFMKNIADHIKKIMAAIGDVVKELLYFDKISNVCNSFCNVMTGGNFRVSFPTFDDFKMPSFKIPDCIKDLGEAFFTLISACSNVIVQKFSAFGLAFMTIVNPEKLIESGGLTRLENFADHANDQIQGAAILGFFKLGMFPDGKYTKKACDTLQKLIFSSRNADTKAAAVAALAAIKMAHGLNDLAAGLGKLAEHAGLGNAAKNAASFASAFGISF